MKYFLPYLFLIINSIGFTQINHWETIVNETDVWKYTIPDITTSNTWIQPSFDDSGWQAGPGGIGFGDNDDNTTIPTNSVSVYMRRTFSIVDVNAIKKFIFCLDYDDGFVAYLNGVMITRKGFSGSGQPAWDALSSISHEAVMFSGGQPDKFTFIPSLSPNLLVQGTNVLCIEVHNNQTNSNDLSSRPFLLGGISDTLLNYSTIPNWFAAPIDFFESTLPIVVVNTNFMVIPDEPKIDATMGIIYDHNGDTNSLDDSFNEFYGQISIERRGSSSNGFPAKSYGLETNGPNQMNYNASIFNWPIDNDWILYAPYTDKAIIRNTMTFKWGNDMGHYAPRTKICELILNNEYMGIYVFMERIKINPGRVPIDDLAYNDTLNNELSGGYILKIDKTTAGGVIAWNSPYPSAAPGNSTISLQLHDPELDTIHPLQLAYIQDYFTAFEDALAGPNFTDPIQGYSPFIDRLSFIDFFLANEITKNVDGYRISSYMYKQKFSEGGKIVAGPLWDFNITLGNANYCQGGLTSGWAKDFNSVCGGGLQVPFYWSKLLSDTIFANEVNCRWTTLRQGVLSDSMVMMYIDSMATTLDSASVRHFQRWPILGVYVWPNNFIGQTFAQEINYLKTWLSARFAWMDANMFGSCTNVSVPEEVGSEIRVFPNPANDYFYIEGMGSPTTGCILNSMGQEIRKLKINTFNFQVETSSLPAGIYYLQLENINSVYKLIITH